jgi:hypothetical protein
VTKEIDVSTGPAKREDDLENCENSSAGISGTKIGFISGVTFGPRAVKYEVIDGLAVFEGDIVLGAADDLDAELEMLRSDPSLPIEAIVITGSRHRWPNGVVPWDIDPTLPNQARVTDAIQHWETSTSFTFPVGHPIMRTG